MKNIFRYIIIALLCATANGVWGQTETYTMTITASDFETEFSNDIKEKTSTAYNSDKTKTYTVRWAYKRVRNDNNFIIFGNSTSATGTIYNTTKLGSIDKISFDYENGQNVFINSHENPGSNGNGRDFFSIRYTRTASGKFSTITISFTPPHFRRDHPRRVGA